jgi:hypothetical protein
MSIIRIFRFHSALNFLFGIIIEKKHELKFMRIISPGPLLILTLFFVSCSTNRDIHSSRKNIDGNWQLLTFVTEGGNRNMDAIILNEAPLHCFVGSSWSFNTANKTGNYSLAKNGDQCNEIKRDFNWTLYYAKNEPSLLQMRRLDKNLVEIPENRTDFSFILVKSAADSMQMRSESYFDGKPVSLVFNFVRTK